MLAAGNWSCILFYEFKSDFISQHLSFAVQEIENILFLFFLAKQLYQKSSSCSCSEITFDNFIFHVKAVNRVAEFVLAEHCTADSFCIFSYVTQSKQRCLIHFKLKVALKCFESIKEQRLCLCMDGRQRRFIEEKVTVCGAIQACWGGERGVCWLQER